jgi:hypothetical protein
MQKVYCPLPAAPPFTAFRSLGGRTLDFESVPIYIVSVRQESRNPLLDRPPMAKHESSGSFPGALPPVGLDCCDFSNIERRISAVGISLRPAHNWLSRDAKICPMDDRQFPYGDADVC